MNDQTQAATILPEQFVKAAQVLAFAQANGFPKASILYWDVDNAEYGLESLEEILEESSKARVSIGLSLNGPDIECFREWNDDADDWGPIQYRQT
jgi:hypothetical protein